VQATQPANAAGAHHTFYATVFLKTAAQQPTTLSAVVGNTSTTGTPNVAAQEFRYGFQVLATEVPTNRGGASLTSADAQLQGTAAGGLGILPATTRGTPPSVFGAEPGRGGFDYRLAEDVISFGVATDTWAGPAEFNAAQVGGANPAGFTINAIAGNDPISGPT